MIRFDVGKPRCIVSCLDLSGKTYFDEGKPGNFKLNVFKMVVLNMYMRSHSVVETLRAGEKKGSDETLLLYRHEEGDSPVINFVEMGAVEVNVGALIYI